MCFDEMGMGVGAGRSSGYNVLMAVISFCHIAVEGE